LNVLVEGAFDVMDEIEDALLAFRRESLGDVGLAEGLAEVAISGADAAAPTRLHLFGAGKSVAVKIEILVDKCG